MPGPGFNNHFVQVVIPGIAVRMDVGNLLDAPEISPDSSVFVDSMGIGAVIFRYNLCGAAALQ